MPPLRGQAFRTALLLAQASFAPLSIAQGGKTALRWNISPSCWNNTTRGRCPLGDAAATRAVCDVAAALTTLFSQPPRGGALGTVVQQGARGPLSLDGCWQLRCGIPRSPRASPRGEAGCPPLGPRGVPTLEHILSNCSAAGPREAGAVHFGGVAPPLFSFSSADPWHTRGKCCPRGASPLRGGGHFVFHSLSNVVPTSPPQCRLCPHLGAPPKWGQNSLNDPPRNGGRCFGGPLHAEAPQSIAPLGRCAPASLRHMPDCWPPRGWLLLNFRCRIPDGP